MIRTNLGMLAALVARAIATGGPWTAPHLILWRQKANTPQPTPADFEQPTYSGYAAVDPAWDGPRSYGNSAVGDSISETFAGVAPETGDFVPDTVIGWALLNTAANKVLFWDTLPEPRAIRSATDRFTVHINLRLGQNMVLGTTEVT